MLNVLTLVGRMSSEIKLTESEGKKVAKITIAIPRHFKNEQGIYETDFIPCVLYGNIATNTKEYCEKGDLIGIKGMLQMQENMLVVVADKVTFLSSKKKDGDENED